MVLSSIRSGPGALFLEYFSITGQSLVSPLSSLSPSSFYVHLILLSCLGLVFV